MSDKVARYEDIVRHLTPATITRIERGGISAEERAAEPKLAAACAAWEAVMEERRAQEERREAQLGAHGKDGWPA